MFVTKNKFGKAGFWNKKSKNIKE